MNRYIMTKNIILICGLNGAGKSTLGRALAKELNYRFIDIEDIYFPKNDPDYLYANPRSFEEVKSILSDITSKNDSFVLASVKGNFGKDMVEKWLRSVSCHVIRIDWGFT